MRCLAVNTATKNLSVALTRDGALVHLFETSEMRDQGNLLLTHARAALEEGGLSFADLDLLAVVTGPGSFTGIRVGLAAMRGVALASNKPLVGVTAFDMFSSRTHDAINIVAIESWRDELYFAVLDEEGHPLIECSNETPEKLAARLAAAFPKKPNLIVSGDAAETVLKHLPNAVLDTRHPNAADVARLAVDRFKLTHKAEKPTPYYMRGADVTISTKPSKSLA